MSQGIQQPVFASASAQQVSRGRMIDQLLLAGHSSFKASSFTPIDRRDQLYFPPHLFSFSHCFTRVDDREMILI